MRILALLVTFVTIGLAPRPVVAQSDAPRVYMSYFKVDFTDVPAWIESYQAHDVPLLQGMVDDGLIIDFGLWAHDTGGEYNLVSTVVAPNWDAVGDFYDAYFAQMPPEAMAEVMPMIRKHTDEIWVIAQAPVEGGVEAPVIYESAWHVDFGELEQWDADFERYGEPALERAAAEGLITGWAKLAHDTGGPWNVKFLYWLNDWDDADELIQMLGEGRTGQDPEAMRAARAHEDHVWRAVPKTPGG